MTKAETLLAATVTTVTLVRRRCNVIGAALGAALAVASFTPSAWAGGDLAPPPPPFSWTGPYIGVHAGWMQTDLDWAFNPPVPAASNQAFSLSSDDWVWGFHLGYQHQFGQWVAGVEFAFNATSDDWGNHSGFGIGPGFGCYTSAAVTPSLKSVVGKTLEGRGSCKGTTTMMGGTWAVAWMLPSPGTSSSASSISTSRSMRNVIVPLRASSEASTIATSSSTPT